MDIRDKRIKRKDRNVQLTLDFHLCHQVEESPEILTVKLNQNAFFHNFSVTHLHSISCKKQVSIWRAPGF
jgi:hypothetical protein